ncbi:glycerophosphodiester phosphodiesterase family protein [Zunongwangia atlantica]|uniref:Glycerophosphoryl diester phosphodiesterase n=1 Tax=Zunongwangia atlantica 22II14-10F7 TaxID=1185767 RepID=A0A1Y1T2V5_9FLAO|nr:glycerophosphodiester phosphodiesterase family protein [Zunongwangia atlantica]ORL45112.1 glycerophosphoryl diester phosphodiesterase [Zunongwangia atlantica 22II14-10F7]
MKFVKISLLFIAFVSFSCKENQKEENTSEEKITSETSKIEVQGHRGERGHSPENSIPGFLASIDKGIDVVEMDVVMSKDKKIVVSHEAFMSSAYVLSPSGDTISKQEEKSYNLFTMTYDSIKKFDIGSKGNTSFPEQRQFKTYKPLLTETIDSIENYVKSKNLDPVRYNIEIKSDEAEYEKSQPKPAEFVKAVMEILEEKEIVSKINIQSFDVNILEEMHRSYPEVKLAYLVGRGEFDENMEKISFKPAIYSPHYKLLDSIKVAKIQKTGMKVIPWTVNEQVDIDKVKKMNVDGIITDYPERAIE